MAPLQLPSSDALFWRKTVFELTEGGELWLSTEQWDELEPLIFNIYTKRRINEELKKLTYDEWFCRLHVNSRESSSKDENLPANARRTTSKLVRTCEATIRVERWKKYPTLVRILATEGHDHSLTDSDVAKLPQHLVHIIAGEADKGYSPVAIRDVVAAHVPDQPKLDYQTTVNVARRVNTVKTEKFLLAKGGTLADDISGMKEKLVADGWRADNLSVINQDQLSSGVIFAKEKHLQHLKDSGDLIIMDASHKTNCWDWYLFALTVRDKYGEWQRGGYFVADQQNNEVVRAGLEKLRQWTDQGWVLYKVLIDDSSIEKLGIKKAFPGLAAGEQEVNIYLCTVHSMRTLMRRIGHLPKVLDKMIGAMFLTTKSNCSAMVKEAINLVPSGQDSARLYLEKEWLPYTEEWALWNRQHSPQLLQITTTNAGESHFRLIKRKSRKQ